MGIIGSIRKHSWIAVAVVGGAIIAFIIGDVWKNNSRIPDMGKINNSTITYQRFNELTEEMENNYKRQQGVSQVPADVEYQLRDQVWQTLVGETLTEEQLNKLGLTVTNAELSDMYLGNFIHPYLRQSFTDPKTGTYQTEAIQYYLDNFENLDTAQRMQWMELEKAVKADRKQQKYSNLIARGMYMPNNIAKQIAEMGNQLSNVTALNLTYQSVEDGEITLSDEDYQNYYKKHKAEFRVREELRELDYIVYPIVPTAQDMANIQAEVEKTWEEFQTIEPDELIFFVNSESDHSYDSTYRKASEFTSPMDSALMAAGEGSLISPRIAGNEWIMGKVLKVANRPDSIRASLIQILNSKVGGNITRGDEQAKLLADSVLNVLRSGAMTFEEAVEKYSEDPQKSSNGGDMGWQLDGYYGLLNEERYARRVFEEWRNKKVYGRLHLQAELRKKNVSEKYIPVLLREFTEDEERQRALAAYSLVRKRRDGHYDCTTEKGVAALVRFLTARGFGGSMIHAVLAQAHRDLESEGGDGVSAAAEAAERDADRGW